MIMIKIYPVGNIKPPVNYTLSKIHTAPCVPLICEQPFNTNGNNAS